MLIIILGTLLFGILFILQSARFWKNVTVASHFSMVDIAAAGDIKKNTPMNRPLILDLSPKDDAMSKLQATLQDERYVRYIVSGYSMLLANIHTNDVVLADAQDKLTKDSKFPCVVVLKRDAKALSRAAEEKDFAKFKLRRAWTVCTIKDVQENGEKILDAILSMNEFAGLKESHGENFMTNYEMKKDFYEYRMKNYKEDYPQCEDPSSPYFQIVISTTLHANPATHHPETFNKVTFSIHPLILVQGIVKKSFRTEE